MRPVLVTGGTGFSDHIWLTSWSKRDMMWWSWTTVTLILERCPPVFGSSKATCAPRGMVGRRGGGRPCGLIHHLGAINGTARFDREAIDVIDVAVNGALQAIDAARRWGARLVMASSPEAYGEAPDRNHNDERSTFTPPKEHLRHSYGASKYLVEVMAQAAAQQGLDVRIARPCNAYGPRPAAGRTDKWWR